jgi:hypothetical protein
LYRKYISHINLLTSLTFTLDIQNFNLDIQNSKDKNALIQKSQDRGHGSHDRALEYKALIQTPVLPTPNKFS